MTFSMVFKLPGRIWLTIALLAMFSGIAIGEVISQMSGPDIENTLQDCPFVQELNHHRKANAPQTSGVTAQVFEKLFPYGSQDQYGPAINALLATLYISGPPNFLLALCPPNIDPSSLSVMVAFAVGGLLGDTLFHLLPEIFLGEAAQDHARFVLVNPNKNLLLGVAIIIGFLTFVAMDKSLRIATGGEGGHDHSHTHKIDEKKSKEKDLPSAIASGSRSAEEATGHVKSRKSRTGSVTISGDQKSLKLSSVTIKKLADIDEPTRSTRWLEEVLEEDPEHGVTQIAIWKAYEAAFKSSSKQLLEATVFIHNASKAFSNASAQIIEEPEKKFIIRGIRPRQQAEKAKPKVSQAVATTSKPEISSKEPSQSIRLSAYLNLIADFTHNITDGLALSSSFYASPTLGATTTVAVFFHEIPHEVGDFALLIQSGFSKRQAMGAQFVTALGAFMGTCLGILVQELGKSGPNEKTQASQSKGLAGTGLGWEDMLLPFTAGTFLYVGTVAVIPELLETGPNKKEEARKTLYQFMAMALGAGIMLVISWS